MSQGRIPRRQLWSGLVQALQDGLLHPARRAAPPRPAARRAPEPTPPAPPELPPVPLRPPGARPELDFLEACRRCGACREACAPGVLLALGEAYGAAAGTPGLFPESGPCELCEDLPCAAACPSGALEAPATWTAVRLGLARVAPDLCLDVTGTPCDLCALTCPTEVRAIRLTSRGPRVDPDRCTGCGLCVAACPTEPKAMRVWPPHLA